MTNLRRKKQPRNARASTDPAPSPEPPPLTSGATAAPPGQQVQTSPPEEAPSLQPPAPTVPAGRPDPAPSPLAELVRRWVEKHPDAVRDTLSVASGRSWDTWLGHSAREIEQLRARFPLDRIRAARRVLDVLRRLHRDDAYTFGLCIGRVLSWDEAMVFKTLPTPPAERSER